MVFSGMVCLRQSSWRPKREDSRRLMRPARWSPRCTTRQRFAKDDLEILLIGHAGHEEVEGTTGEAPGHITLVQSPADVDRARSSGSVTTCLAQPDHAER